MNKMDQWNDLIIKSAEAFRIDCNLIRAVIMIESSGNPTAVRFESHWHLYNCPQAYSEKLGITREEEERMQATSWGLMQVMGATARDLGLTDNIEMLNVPQIGVFYGCKKLKQLFQRYPDEDQVVSAYNQGNARMANGMFCNQRYVDKIYSILRPLRVLK